MVKQESIEYYTDLAIDVAQKNNVDAILCHGIEGLNNQIRFSQNKIDINCNWQSKELKFLLVVEGNHMVTSNFSPTSDDMVKKEITNAIEFAKTTDPSMFYAGLEDKIHTYSTIEQTYDPKINDFMEKSPELVNAAIQAAIDEGAKRIAGSLLFGKTKLYMVNSFGPKGSHETSFYNMTARAFQDSLDESGQGLTSGRMLTDVENKFVQAGKTAGKYSKMHKNCKQAEAGTYDIIFNPTVASNLMGGLVESANPLMIMIGLSPFADKMGSQIGPEFLTVEDDPFMPNGLRSLPFDAEGSPHQKIPVIENGVLKNLVHNTSTAKMMGAESTGSSELVNMGVGSDILAPSFTNIVFNNGDQSFDELLQTDKPAIYVTCNWYTRFTSNITTEFSTIPRDAAFMVENGELEQPIKNFRISDNLLRMMKNIDAVGNNRTQVSWWEVMTPTFMPTLRIKDCRVTTATK